MTVPGRGPSRPRMTRSTAARWPGARQVLPDSGEHHGTSGRGAAAESAYHHVADRLAALIPLLGLQEAHPLIERSYELLCHESLAFRYGRRPARPSRLNADGTPFQFSLTVCGSKPPLQFVADTCGPLATNAQRISSDRARIRALSALCGTDLSLPSIYGLLDEIVPPADPRLLAEGAGATWLGMSFSPDQGPRFKIYINIKWGDPETRWARLATFSACIGATACWHEARAILGDELEPLGVSLVIGPRSTSGRIYLSAYGKPFSYYEVLAGIFAGRAFEQHLCHFGAAFLQQDYGNPTQSVVCSLGIQSGQFADFKVELCGHCAFDSDVEAEARCVKLLQQLDMNTAYYLPVVTLLSQGRLSASRARLHAYLGTGSGGGYPYVTFYFNPAAVIG